MRKFLIMMLLAGLFACNRPDAGQTVISGVIQNMEQTELEVAYYKDYLINNELSVSATVGSDGTFKAILTLEQGEFISIRTAQRSIALYALPGARIHVEFDAQDPDVKTHVGGEQAYESIFMADFAHDIERFHSRALVINSLSQKEAANFRADVDSIYGLKQAYLDGHSLAGELDREFVEIMQANILYEKYRILLEYPLYYAYFNQLEDEPELPEHYFDFLSEAAGFHTPGFTEHMRSRSYISFLTTYLDYLVEKMPLAEQAGKNYFDMQFETGGEVFTGESRDFALSQTMVSVLYYENFDRANDLYARYLKMVPAGPYRRIVASEYETIQKLSPGYPAPDFSGTDIEGNRISLSDYRGQVVYLDFWASWCGPCMREMPHSKELKRVLADQHDLVFMYVSVDTDESAWRNTVALHDIKGVHLNFPGSKQGAPFLYNVRSVPAFFIIGRDGRIFDNRPPRPSDPAIYETLMAALLE